MPSTYFDMTAADAALKQIYPDGKVPEDLVYKKNPLVALVNKFTEFGGELMKVPVIIGTSQGRSASFANAQANQTAANIAAFLLTTKDDYSIATITNKAMMAAKTDAMAFVRNSKVVIDGAMRVAVLSQASGGYRDGTGTIGQINASGLSTGVITLMNLPDVVQFEIGQTLQCNTTSGGTPRAALGYVIAVDRSAGTVTVSTSQGGAAGTPTSWGASEYLLVQGDNNAKPSGLAAWLPTTAPTSSDNFYGVNRSADPVRLAGVRYDASAQSIEEGLVDGLMLGMREGADISHYFGNYATYGALEKALGSKVQYIDLEGPAKIAFRGIRLNGGDREVNVIPDRNCPSLRGYGLQLDTWTLGSLGDAPQILRYGDGLEMLRVSTADASEVRIGSYSNWYTTAPGWNVAFTMAQ